MSAVTGIVQTENTNIYSVSSSVSIFSQGIEAVHLPFCKASEDKGQLTAQDLTISTGAPGLFPP